MNVSVVAHNLIAMNGSRQLNISSKNKSKSAERLASGYRINRAADDAAGLTVSEKMRHQINSLDRGEQNTQDGISFCQTADGAMNEIHDLLNRMQELCVQAANDTNSEGERSCIQSEINQIKLEISRISTGTEFNRRPVFRGLRQKPIHTDDSYVDDSHLGDVSIPSSPSLPGAALDQTLTLDATYTSTGASSAGEGQSGSAGKNNYTYASVEIDFNDPNSEYYSRNLVGKSICVLDSETDEKYTILFGDSSSTHNREYAYDKDTNTMIVNAQGGPSGTTLVGRIINACKNNTDFVQGHVQFARRSLDAGKLWIYDNRSANAGNSPIRWGKDSDFPAQTPGQPPVQPPVQPPAQDSDSVTDETDDSEDSEEIWIQAGADSRSGMFIKRPDISMSRLGLEELDVEVPGGANKALEMLDYAREIVSSERSLIGAQQNRLEHMMNINANTSENLTHAESVIRDTDMAAEMVNFMKHNVLEQAGQSMLAQANQLPQQVLSLLQ